MSWGGRLALGLLTTLLIAGWGWSMWQNVYWSSAPQRIATESDTVWGVIDYSPAYRGDYHYTLHTLGGEVIGLSCQSVWTQYTANACLEPLAVNGLAQWRPDARKAVAPGPLVEVGFVWSPTDPRFNAVAVSARRNGVDYLDRATRLAEAGIDPSARSYSKARYRQAQRRRLEVR